MNDIDIIEQIMEGYWETMFWSNMADIEEESEIYGKTIEDVHWQAIADITTKVTLFYAHNKQLLTIANDKYTEDWGRIGHDLFLTTNHHGAGFWDGDYGEDLGEALTEACRMIKSQDFYTGDDGIVYMSEGY